MKVTSKFFLAAVLTVTAGVAGLKSANAANYDWNFIPGADGVLPSSVTITNGSPPLMAFANGPSSRSVTGTPQGARDLKRLKETKIYCDRLCRRCACIRWNC